MPNNVVHFAIHADDVPRAKAFYEGVFGWHFEPWGPPGFFLIRTGTEGDPGIMGALQKRMTPLDGTGTRGYECSISVDSIEEITLAINRHGGTITLEKCAIPTVGWLTKFVDTEGNEVAAVHYDQRAGV